MTLTEGLKEKVSTKLNNFQKGDLTAYNIKYQ